MLFKSFSLFPLMPSHLFCEIIVLPVGLSLGLLAVVSLLVVLLVKWLLLILIELL
jgi:hypothetical protein